MTLIQAIVLELILVVFDLYSKIVLQAKLCTVVNFICV